MKKTLLISTITLLLLFALIILCKFYFFNEPEIFAEFREKARIDIQKDSVKSFSQGLPLPPKTEQGFIEEKIYDSVNAKYGLYHENLGCIISDEFTKAQNEYYKITNVYLEKRNGKGWQAKMKNEIDSLIKNYR